MNRKPRWISKRAVLLLHQESLAEFGGATGIRDEGLLESALARPLNLYSYNSEAAIEELAAAYGAGIARNHPFVDGNKRAALLAVGLFLGLNGLRLAASQADAVRTMLALAAGELDERGLSEWIAAHLRARRKEN